VSFTPEFILQSMLAIASGVGAYAAIRADLATLHERATAAAASADKAHQRIDQFINHQKG
jgi:hypothetical protein